VGGFVNAVLLLSLSMYVALDAIPRLFKPPVHTSHSFSLPPVLFRERRGLLLIFLLLSFRSPFPCDTDSFFARLEKSQKSAQDILRASPQTSSGLASS